MASFSSHGDACEGGLPELSRSTGGSPSPGSQQNGGGSGITGDDGDVALVPVDDRLVQFGRFCRRGLLLVDDAALALALPLALLLEGGLLNPHHLPRSALGLAALALGLAALPHGLWGPQDRALRRASGRRGLELE